LAEKSRSQPPPERATPTPKNSQNRPGHPNGDPEPRETPTTGNSREKRQTVGKEDPGDRNGADGVKGTVRPPPKAMEGCVRIVQALAHLIMALMYG